MNDIINDSINGFRGSFSHADYLEDIKNNKEGEFAIVSEDYVINEETLKTKQRNVLYIFTIEGWERIGN